MSKVPNFRDIDLFTEKMQEESFLKDWQNDAQKESGTEWKNLSWETPEGIFFKPVYCDEDYEKVGHLGTYPGIPPYIRGPYSSMYVTKPWTIRQYAGFSTAEESNAFYNKNLEKVIILKTLNI